MDNIVVVEDEAITAMDIQGRLEKMGYHVSAVTMTGEEAIQLAGQLKPDLVIMDITLKGDMEGTEAALEISNRYNIPIIFLTAYKDYKTFSRAKLANPFGYLTKPVDTMELNNTIELALYKGEMISKIISAEKRYHALMDNANFGIIVHDINGDIKEANIASEKIFGMCKSELIGKNINTFLPKDEIEYFHLKLNKLLHENDIEINVGHIMRPNGTIRDVEMLATRVTLHSEDLLFSIINDITDKNRFLAKSTFNEKLTTLGQLSAGIIHEINNPLAAIQLNVDLALDSLSKNNDVNDAIDIIGQIKASVKRIKAIVSDLKEFGRKDDDVSLKDIHEIIESSINISSPYFKNNANIVRKFSPDIPKILLNSGKLEQVLVNLIINASQSFLSANNYDSNTITISTKIEKIMLYIDIADTGSGISQNILKDIFEPFFTTKPAGVGTGLGLSICQQIVQALGGEISVKSSVGTGTTFTIRLPVKIMLEHASDNYLPFSSVINKVILIVDNDTASVDILKIMLEKSNNITIANSGREALNILKKSPGKFELIISELSMPDINGADLYQYLCDTQSMLAKNMIFIVEKDLPDSLTKFVKRINCPTLSKPYTSNQLFDVIKSIQS